MQDDASVSVSARLSQLVSRYARRVYPAVLAQHGGAAVCSPLGIWLLLVACATCAEGEDLRALEQALGCPAGEAGQLLARLMVELPPALLAAIAVWVQAADANALAGWVRALPPGVASGLMPSQADADAWTDRETRGLIERCPLALEASVRIALVSALATKVSWEQPFEVVPAQQRLAEGSPWRARVQRLLDDSRQPEHAMLARTRAAGLVAVHLAVAKERLTVISVSADPDVPRAAVLDAAHELAGPAFSDPTSIACSLFELPLGTGHSWQIDEREIVTPRPGGRVERIAAVSLPAWRVQSDYDLKASELYGCMPALEAVRALIGPRAGDQTEAKQTAVASFARYGFEAAASTAFAVQVSRRREIGSPQTGLERAATLRFDHPFAAVAIAGRPARSRYQPHSAFSGLPPFGAWIAEPLEVEEDLPAT